MVSGIAPQLTATKRPARRLPRSCSARAATSLPVPVSPKSSTSVSASASSASRLRKRATAGECPTTRAAHGSSAWAPALSERFSMISRRYSLARRIVSIRRTGSAGFSTKSQAPSRIAFTAMGTSAWPVISTTGISASTAVTAESKPKPSRPGMRTSLTTTTEESRPSSLSAASPERLAMTAKPSSSSVNRQASSTSASSSTRTTLGALMRRFPAGP